MKKTQTKYEVLESDGSQVRRRKVVNIKGYTDGLVLTYEADGKLDIVYLSHKYRPLRYKRRYWVGKRLGNNSACEIVDEVDVPIAGPLIATPSDKNCPGDDLSQLALSNIFGIGVLTVFGKRNVPWVLIIVIAVALGAVVWYIRRGGF